MTLHEFKPILLSKSTDRTVLPLDEDLQHRIFTGLQRIARETMPLRLLRTAPNSIDMNFSVMRKLDTHTYIRFPNKPLAPEDEIDIDDELIDALALYVMAGLEKTNAKTYMGLYYTEIEENNDRLTETDLNEASNEVADRFRVFP